MSIEQTTSASMLRKLARRGLQIGATVLEQAMRRVATSGLADRWDRAPPMVRRPVERWVNRLGDYLFNAGGAGPRVQSPQPAPVQQPRSGQQRGTFGELIQIRTARDDGAGSA